jgi:peptidoglycan/xylan/chitin deacetylase (PgdA/CDA1 family)
VTTVARWIHQLPDSAHTPDDKVVALTFDDAPGPHTAPVLDALAACGVTTTFFVAGVQLDDGHDTLARIVADGHTLGNQSWSHTRLEQLDDATIVDEFARTDARVSELTGAALHVARPPYTMDQAPRLAQLVERLGYTAVVGWSVDPGDGPHHDATTITERVVEELHPGAIVLLRAGADEGRSTAAAIKPIVRAATVLGYRFVTL